MPIVTCLSMDNGMKVYVNIGIDEARQLIKDAAPDEDIKFIDKYQNLPVYIKPKHISYIKQEDHKK